jgi:beta-1,4-N-acetylglucosaminyltransferase
MIFVTVGTHHEGFDRLLKELDSLAGQGKIREVFAQIGQSSYVPSNFKWTRLEGPQELKRHYAKANVVVTHGGAGSVIWGISSGKPLVIVPRLAKFGEVVDDHQLDLAKKLEMKMGIMVVYDMKDLGGAISKAKAPKDAGVKESGLCKVINEYLDLL